jgi:hypothetical protein
LLIFVAAAAAVDEFVTVVVVVDCCGGGISGIRGSGGNEPKFPNAKPNGSLLLMLHGGRATSLGSGDEVTGGS